MERRDFITLLGASAATAVAAPSLSAEAWVGKLNAYFNSVKTAFAPFTQTNPNGSKVTGRFYLSKPGKMRFEYDDPKQPMLVADGAVMAVFDKKSNMGPQKYPQINNPLSLLAKSNLDLTGTKYVRKISQSPSTGEALITVADPSKSQYGSLILRVNMKESKLKGWQAIDKGGNRTTISLHDFHTGVAMNPDLFNIVKLQKQ